MSDVVSSFALHIEQIDGYQFRVRFDKPQHADLVLDEPPPLGHDAGPNPARILAAAIGDCLSASLTFCLAKAGIQLSGLRSEVNVDIVRNEHKRLRIGKVRVRLLPRTSEDAPALLACLGSFEDFCVVTQSVRQGLPVEVQVEPQPVA